MSETLSVQVKYRPLRIGFCVEAGDFDGLRKAVRLTNVFWGGCFNPIIPINNEKLAKQLISVFRVDFLYPVSNTNNVENFIKKFDYLPYPFFYEKLFPKLRNSIRSSVILDVYHAIGAIYENHFKNVHEPKIKVRIYKWEENDILKDIFLMNFGDYPEEEILPIDYLDMLKKNLNAQEIKISSNQEHPVCFLEELTPLSITQFQLIPHYSIRNYWQHNGLYIGNCSDFEDLVSYWNLRAAGVEVLFYDPDRFERFEPLKNFYLSKMLSLPIDPEREKNRVGLWLKPQQTDKDYSAFCAEPTVCFVNEGIWNGLNIKPLYFYFFEKSVLGTLHESEGKTSLSFQLPENPFYKKSVLNGQNFIVSVNAGSIGSISNDNETLRIPYIPELNTFYENGFFGKKIRIEPYGIGFIKSINSSALTIYAVNVIYLVNQIFGMKKISVTLSQSGIICKNLIQQMGGLSACRVFRISGLRNIIKKKKVSESSTRSGIIESIRQQNSNEVKFKKYEDLFIEPREFHKKLKPDDVLTFLLKKKVFMAGLEFKCPNCRLDFWLSLDELKNEISCEYCMKRFNANIQLKDRDWRYRRSGLLGKDNNQEGALPVIIMLEQIIFSTFGEGYLYITAAELKSSDHGINCETDFIILGKTTREGRIQIVIGECKNEEEISFDDIENLMKVASILNENFDVYIIFSKLTKFTQSELSDFKRLDPDHLRRVILLDVDSLESKLIYQNLDEKIIDRYDHSFEGLSNITQQLYFPDSIG